MPYMYFLKHIICIHNIERREDRILAVDVDGKEAFLFGIGPDQIWSCCLVNQVLYIIDTNFCLTRLFLGPSENDFSWPEEKEKDVRSLEHIIELKKIIQNPSIEFKVYMNDTTVIIIGNELKHIISIEAGKVMSRLLPEEYGTKLVLLPNMLLSY